MRIQSLFIIIILTFLSCSDFTTLKITAWYPAHNQFGVARDAQVWVEFNNPVNKQGVEQYFSLTNESGRVSGIFQWVSGSKFYFDPFAEFTTGSRYVIGMPYSVRDENGNSMEQDFISEFYVGNDNIKPTIVTSDPLYTEGGTTNVDPNIAEISITFSEAMNKMLTENAFSISPDIPGYFAWYDGDTRLAYVLTSGLDDSTQYRVTMSSTAEDISGNRLNTTYQLVFITGNDFTQPEISGISDDSMSPPPYWDVDIINTGVSRFSMIYIDFSEPMDQYVTESAFSITPYVNGTFTWSTPQRMVYNPTTQFDSDTVYSISISKSAMDQHGLNIRNEYDISFKTNAPDSQLISIADMYGSCDNGNNYAYTQLYDGVPPADWPIWVDMGDPANQALNKEKDYYFKVRFKNDSGIVALDPYSLIDNVVIEPYDPATIADILFSGDKTEATILFDGLANNQAGSTPILYRVTFAGGNGGIKDKNGNSLKENFIFEFKDM
jgi:hypothetical protein